MVQRLSSDLWVATYLRQCRLNGSFAYLAKRGAFDAGAIFVKIIKSNGTVCLYGPAPQSEVSTEANESASWGEDSRVFELLLEDAEASIESRLNTEMSFDPDIWIVEIEDAEGRHALRLAD